jgi:hypothetical protein
LEKDKSMNELADDLDRAVEEELAKAEPLPPGQGRDPVPLRPAARRPQTIDEQVQQLEQIERQIDARIRRSMIEAKIEAERRITDAHARFDRSLSEETARLMTERDEEVRQATDDCQRKLYELAGLSRRRA